jgi:hypothetical protein
LGFRDATRHCILARVPLNYAVLEDCASGSLGTIARRSQVLIVRTRSYSHPFARMRASRCVAMFSLQTGRLTVGRIGRRYLGANNVLTFRIVDNDYEMTRNLGLDKTATLHTLATVPSHFSVSLPSTIQIPSRFPSLQRDIIFSTHISPQKHSPQPRDSGSVKQSSGESSVTTVAWHRKQVGLGTRYPCFRHWYRPRSRDHASKDVFSSATICSSSLAYTLH